MGDEIIYKEECYQIQGAIFEVYREMGSGFLEAVYQECLEKELRLKSIPFFAQKELPLNYKGEKLSQTYQPDLICYGKIIVELKAVKEIGPEHKAQVINYLKASGRFFKEFCGWMETAMRKRRDGNTRSNSLRTLWKNAWT